MNKKKLLLGFIIFILGLTGVASILTMELPLPPEAVAILNERFTPGQIKLLLLINPTILLLVAVVVGTILYQKVNLKVPLIEKAVGIQGGTINFTEVVKYGVLGGILSGVLITLVGAVFNPILPEEFKELGESLQPTIAARFLYGGITEEILMRFGLMTLIVWGAYKILKNKKPVVYWVGVLISALLFAVGHFPVAFQAVGDPSAGLLTYIIIGNSIGGIIFGWLYWKKGLESAFIAHIFTHVVMLLAEPIVN